MSNKTQCPMSLINLVMKQCERFLLKMENQGPNKQNTRTKDVRKRK